MLCARISAFKINVINKYDALQCVHLSTDLSCCRLVPVEEKVSGFYSDNFRTEKRLNVEEIICLKHFSSNLRGSAFKCRIQRGKKGFVKIILTNAFH